MSASPLLLLQRARPGRAALLQRRPVAREICTVTASSARIVRAGATGLLKRLLAPRGAPPPEPASRAACDGHVLGTEPTVLEVLVYELLDAHEDTARLAA